jgi:hypothetical protein
MFILKACPRCHGDLIGESDVPGDYMSCLACGHLLTAEEEQMVRRSAPTPKRQRPKSDRAGAA